MLLMVIARASMITITIRLNMSIANILGLILIFMKSGSFVHLSIIRCRRFMHNRLVWRIWRIHIDIDIDTRRCRR